MDLTTGILLAVIVIIAIIVISIANGIIAGKNNVKRNWADVITYIRYKIELIPKLEEAIGKYSTYESGLLEKITKIRSSLNSVESSIEPSALQKIDTATKEVFTGLQVAVESYPQLKASELYTGLMREMTEAERNIAASITIFNQGVNSFNNSIQTFPGSLINNLFVKAVSVKEFNDSGAKSKIEYQPNI